MSLLLDNLVKIKALDKEWMCGILERFPENCEDAIKRSESLKIPKMLKVSETLLINYRQPKKIIVSGMGGSAIGGNILRDWLKDTLPIPIEVCRDYHLPAYADDETLVLVLSYSGNTEETLSVFLEAIERRCMLIAISSDGVLEEFSQKMELPFVKLPEGFPPRTAIPYLFFPLVISLKKLGVLTGVDDEIKEAIAVLKKVREEIKPAVITNENLAKKIALDVEGSIPAIYGFGFYEGVALRIKTQFNENSKSPSLSICFPELDHNEIVGWMGKDSLTKNFTVILIRDKDEPPEINARIDVTRRLVFDRKARKIIELRSIGNGKLSKILSTMYIGDFASVYLALLYGLNPTPVDIIEQLKKQLEERMDKVEEYRGKFMKILEKGHIS